MKPELRLVGIGTPGRAALALRLSDMWGCVAQVADRARATVG